MASRIVNNFLWATTLGLVALSSCNTSSTEAPSSPTTNEPDSAVIYEQKILSDADSPEPYLDRAAWHLRNGRIKEGLDDLNLSIKADSTYGPAWSAKGDALYYMQNFEGSIEHLDICLEYAPNNTNCKLRRAEMYIHLSQYEKALALINDALRINNQLHEAYWMKSFIYRDNGQIDKALSSLQTAIEVNPNFFDGYISLGMAYLEMNDLIAIDYFNSAISLRPRSVEAKYNLAMFYQQQDYSKGRENLDNSLILYEEILEIDSTNASAAFNSGFIHLEYLQDYQEAEWWFGQAIEKLPHYHQAFFNRGLARESQDKYTEALEDYNEALRLKPDYTAAALCKSRVLETIGQ
jgi:tetratricopeptide (TPR) repeat protein